MKDYYSILGVTPQAEDIVIKAAYRALAQRYHPDRFSGSIEEAARRMAEINYAYAVLADPAKRREYDLECSREGNGNQQAFDAGDAAAVEGVQQLEQDWTLALEYYPDLVTIEASLARTSKKLAFMFRLYLITEKSFKDRKRIADTMHEFFLKSYFGKKEDILEFAKKLIALGQKDAAKALNEAVRVLGEDIDSVAVISRIKVKFGLAEIFSVRPRTPPPLSAMARALERNASLDDVRRALREHGGGSSLQWRDISAYWSNLQFSGSYDEFIRWFQKFVAPKILEGDLYLK